MFHVLNRFYRRISATIAHQWTRLTLFFLSLMAYATTGFMYFELPEKPDLEWSDAIWWALVTTTTVGYGDLFPESPMGRLVVGIPTMLVGVGILGYILSLLAGVIMESKQKEVRGFAAYRKSNHIIVCNYNGLDATLKLVDEIRSDVVTRDRTIVLVDSQLDELHRELADCNMHFIRGKASRENILERANVHEASHIIIQADLQNPESSDNTNLTIALTVEQMNRGIFSVVQCINPENARFFEHAGVDSVVCVNSLTSQMMIQELQDPGIHSVVTNLTSNAKGKQFYIVDIPNSVSTVAEARDQLQMRYHALLIGLQRGNDSIMAPDPAMATLHDDKVIVIATQRPMI